MTFRVGQKVVCIDGSHEGDFGIFPNEGEIYTVLWIGRFFHPMFKTSELSVHLREIDRPPSVDCGTVVPYRATRFRPLVERKTSIEIFTAMLKPSKVEA